ncbi:alpha-latrocrustotoxin-Lt1a-like [Sitodiplosis mosellana]|uniref:alpha-latrocrustotoxin-Lt1a-like n=1 Tax=Sitodiplosis mosellana TaxID=263140 RepID=UPI002444996E|nr:alpha-latrocrustotoxin-Lt1a-like [Sitodiplosis mosellana]
MNTLFVIVLLVAAFTKPEVAGKSMISKDDDRDKGFQISKNKMNVLLNAIGENDVSKVRSLISEGMNMNFQFDGKTAINIPAQQLDRSFLLIYFHNPDDLLEVYSSKRKGKSVRIQFDKGETPVHIAAKLGFLYIIKLLLDYGGVNVNILDSNSSTPLHEAAEYESWSIAETLIYRGAKINAKDVQARTPLHYAISGGNFDPGRIEFIEFLIGHGADIGAKDSDGLTPLHIAVQKGCMDIAQRLIELGADAIARDNKGRTPYNYAGLIGNLT